MEQNVTQKPTNNRAVPGSVGQLALVYFYQLRLAGKTRHARHDGGLVFVAVLDFQQQNATVVFCRGGNACLDSTHASKTLPLLSVWIQQCSISL